jgi:hypothetical protein
MAAHPGRRGHVARDLLALGRAAHRLAGETAEPPMPGFTHPRAAQVITPGFYLRYLPTRAIAGTRPPSPPTDRVPRPGPFRPAARRSAPIHRKGF